MGKKSERKYINAYIKLNHFDGHLELTQLVNQSYYNFKWKKWCKFPEEIPHSFISINKNHLLLLWFGSHCLGQARSAFLSHA